MMDGYETPPLTQRGSMKKNELSPKRPSLSYSSTSSSASSSPSRQSSMTTKSTSSSHIKSSPKPSSVYLKHPSSVSASASTSSSSSLKPSTSHPTKPSISHSGFGSTQLKPFTVPLTTTSTSSTTFTYASSPLKSLSQPKKPEEIQKIKEFKNKTIERILSKKRDEEIKRFLKNEQELKQLNFNRLKFKQTIKSNKLLEISNFIDVSLALSTLIELQKETQKSNFAKMQKFSLADCQNSVTQKNFFLNLIEIYKNSFNIFQFNKLKIQNEKKLKKFCYDLKFNENNFESEFREPSGSFSLSLGEEGSKVQFHPSGHEREERETLATNFLRHIVSYDLSVKKKLNRYWKSDQDESQGVGHSPLAPSSSSNLLNFPSNSVLTPNTGLVSSSDFSMTSESGFQIPSSFSRLGQISTALDSLLIQYNLQAEPRKLGGIFNKIIQSANAESILPTLIKPPSVIDDQVSTAFSIYNHLPENQATQELFSSLFDSIFLLGPKKSDVHEAYANKKASSTNTSSSSGVLGSSGPAFSGTLTVPASVLYNTENDYPVEMISMLPPYAFPNDVEIEVVAAAELPPKTSKKLFNMKRDKVKKVEVEKKKVMAPSEPFLLTLGDHTYQSYAIVIPIPIRLWDEERKVHFNFWYSLAVFTKFPFVSYLSHIMIYLLKKFQLFSPDYLEDFLFCTQGNPTADGESIDPKSEFHYNILQETIFKFKKIQVPLYPYLKESPFDSPPPSIFNYHLVTPEVNYLSALTDLREFSININNTDLKLPSLPRSMLQNYYSLHKNDDELLRFQLSHSNSISLSPSSTSTPTSATASNVGRLEVSINKLYDKIRHSFSPTEFHKLERDREEIFFILLWSLPTLLQFFSVELVLLTINAFISNELIILFYHPDIKVISKIIFAFLNLLRPLKWCYPIIVTLSEVLYPLLECPFPILIGMDHLVNVDNTENYVLVNAKDQTIQYFNNGKKVPAVSLPNSQKILGQLQQSAAVIRRETSNTPLVNFSMSFDEEGLKIREESPALLEAVRDFMTTLSDHILSIINTSIQLQKDSQQQNKMKRLSARVVAGSEPSSNPAVIEPSYSSSFYNSNSDYETYSLSSTASSIPSVLPNVPSISTNASDFDSTYVRKLLDTQMFTNICQLIKLDRHTNQIIIQNDEGKKELTPRANSKSFLVPEEVEFEPETDVIEELFSIIISGTVLYSADELHAQKQKYQELYQAEYTPEKFDQFLFDLHLPPVPQELIAQVSSAASIRAFQREQIKTYSFNNEYKMIDTDEVLQCNGLFCNGFGNTYKCSNLCLTLWDFHVHNLVRVQQALDIIRKNFEKNNPVEYIVKEGVRLVPKRHSKETEDQYNLRRSAIKKELLLHHDAQPSPVSKTKKKKLSCYVLDKSDMKFKKKTLVHDSNSINFHYARYYEKKQKKLNKRLLCKKFFIIKRFIYAYIIYYKQMKFFKRISKLQAYVRGFLMRLNIPRLVPNLVLRKVERFFAKIRIRNFLRSLSQKKSVFKVFMRNFRSFRKRSGSLSSTVSTNSVSTHASVASVATAATVKSPQVEPPNFKRLISNRSILTPNKLKYQQNPPLPLKTMNSMRSLSDMHEFPISNRRLSDQGRTFLQMNPHASQTRSPRASLPTNLNSAHNMSFLSTNSRLGLTTPNTEVGGYKPSFFGTSNESIFNNVANHGMSSYTLNTQLPNNTITPGASNGISGMSSYGSSNTLNSFNRPGSTVSVPNPSPSKSSSSMYILSEENSNSEEDEVDTIANPESLSFSIKKSTSDSSISHRSDNNNPDDILSDNNSIYDLSTLCHDNNDNQFNNDNFSISGISSAESIVTIGKNIETPKRLTPIGRFAAITNLHIPLKKDYRTVSPEKKFIKKVNKTFNENLDAQLNNNPNFDFNSTYHGDSGSPIIKNNSDHKFLSPITESRESEPVTPQLNLLDPNSPVKSPYNSSSPRSRVSNLTMSSSIDTDDNMDFRYSEELVMPASPINQPQIDPTVMDPNYNPVKALGVEALSFFTYQNLKTIKETWEALKNGIPAIKHCRKGKPKNRILYSDHAMTKLYWKNHNLSGSADDDDSDMTGQVEKKRSSIFRRASLKFRSDREVFFSDMNAVNDECNSDVFQTSLHKNYFSSNTYTLSIFTNERSVDLELSEANFNILYRGLKLLVDYYHHINKNKPKKEK